MERTLTTILAADIAGFSRLIGLDEEGTLAAQRAHRTEFINALLEHYNGRVANTAGDSLLIEFASAVEAVRCALALQEGMASRNASIPENLRILYRIGINVGDVVAQGDDLLGDGVNVAARLEALAPPSGIILSRSVRDQVRDRLDLDLADLDEVSVKNIARPVRAFQVLSKGQSAIRPTKKSAQGRTGLVVATALFVSLIGAGLLWQTQRSEVESQDPQDAVSALPEKPSMAVLPFDNLSGDENQDYFADGLTADLITDLATFPGFQVAARSSTAAYKDGSADLRKVGRELGVQYLIEGSVEKGGGKLRVTAQLTDAASGNHIWADRYDRDVTDLFAIRDEIRASIIGALTGAIVTAEVERARRQSPNSVKARDLYYQALGEWPKFNKEANARARELLQHSITLDPRDAAAHALLAWTHWRDVWIGWSDDAEISKILALETAETAVELDRADYRGYWSLGSALRLYDDYDTAGLHYERAFELNPLDPNLLADWGELLQNNGEFEKAAVQLERALALNPNYPDWYLAVLASTYLFAGRYDEATRTSSRIAHPTNHNRATLAVSLVKLGHFEAAEVQIAKLLAQDPGYSVAVFLGWPGWERRDPDKVQSYVEALRRAGLPE